MRERGQISIAAVGAITLVVLGGVLLAFLSGITAAGGRAQRAADLAAIAAARALGAAPDTTPARLRATAAAAARANGGDLVGLRIVRTGSVPRAVDVAVALPVDGTAPVAGAQDRRVVANARAGIAYSATLPARAFRPVDLHGARGPLAAVAAAEAQIGWPYVWGGESRAEGGFDCSGLVDYAYAAAGEPLPGRPTAADLWRMARPEPEADLMPSDLVFLGSAGGAPYHVGMYVGGGTVVVAPHTGATVRYEPLAAGGWDGFGRLLTGGAGVPVPMTDVEAAARAHQVPPHVVTAELELGLAADPRAAAVALATGLRRGNGDLAAALADALGDRSAAALVLRTASGPALGHGFSAQVRLLPLPAAAGMAGASASLAAGHTAVGGSAGWLGGVELAASSLEHVAEHADHLGERVSVQAVSGLQHVARLGITVAAAFLPSPHLQDMAVLTGAVWDGVDSVRALAAGPLVLKGWALWGARLMTPLGVGFAGLFAWQAWTARRREDRIWYAAQSASSALTSIGAMAAGTDLIAVGAGTAEVPPIGLALMLAGVVVLGGACLYRERRWIGAGVGAAVSVVRRAAGRAAGAVVDAGRTIVDALDPF